MSDIVNEVLRDDPRAPGCEKLGGAAMYHVRQSGYRVVQEIKDAHLVVAVIRVGHRVEDHRR